MGALMYDTCLQQVQPAPQCEITPPVAESALVWQRLRRWECVKDVIQTVQTMNVDTGDGRGSSSAEAWALYPRPGY